jgi:hypothetical protein
VASPYDTLWFVFRNYLDLTTFLPNLERLVCRDYLATVKRKTTSPSIVRRFPSRLME